MDFFKDFVSNTTAGTSNQSFFTEGSGVGRVFYRLLWGGAFEYSLLFSGTVDSTFGNGSVSRVNQLCGPWDISLSCCVCTGADDPELEDRSWRTLTFDGKETKTAAPGALFSTDPVLLDAPAGASLCVQIAFHGDKIPCHPEINIPSYRKEGDAFVLSEYVPVPNMIGCRRPVKARIGFLGDSITQGLGTDMDSYAHWCHKVAQALGAEYACWNLGIGCGRASDAATGGIWLQKALQTDCVVVCFGINDIIQGDGPALCDNLETIISTLKSHGKKVILQSIPPFDFDKQPRIDLWESCNRHIRQVLAPKCDGFLDVSTFLSTDGAGQTTKYGGHPNGEGCSVWTEHLLPVLRRVLEESV